jgi:hypothetical protein
MKGYRLSVIWLLSVLLFFPHISNADPLDNWQWRNPLPQGNPLSAICYGNGLFVAVGYYGTVLTSIDGQKWLSALSGTTDNLVGITFGNGLFIAVGGNGTILKSQDGRTWVATILEGRYPRGIAYGNGTFVVCCYDGTILSSPDGERWTEKRLMVSPLRGIAYGNGMFVTVGGGVDYHGGQIIYTWGIYFTSTDGVSWTGNQMPGGPPYNGVAFCEGSFVLTVFGGPEDDNCLGVAYGNGIFVKTDGSRIFNSHDKITWTEISSGTTNGLFGITNVDGTLVAVGVRDVLKSSDGINWQENPIEYTLTAIAYGNGTYVAINDPNICTSLDGTTWKCKRSEAILTGVSFCNNAFFITGWTLDSSNVIITSSDGITWVTTQAPTSHSLYGVTCGKGIFVAVGYDILTSSDGVTWKVQQLGNIPLFSIAYGNETFVAVGFERIATSLDGVAWTLLETPYRLRGVDYWNMTFVAVGDSILTSRDGLAWVERKTESKDWYGITHGNGTFVAVGEGGRILQSDPLSPPPIAIESPPKGNHFNACSVDSLPLFSWKVSEQDFVHYDVQFAPDYHFMPISMEITVQTPVTQFTVSPDTWKEIGMIPGVSGGTVYWRVVGTRGDVTTETSDISSLVFGAEPAGDSGISPTGKRSKPTLTWQTNCNTKFKAVFGSDSGFTKKTYSIEIANPAGGDFTMFKTLTTLQWMRIKLLVKNKKGSTIYWYIESWDELGRYAKTAAMSFVLGD